MCMSAHMYLSNANKKIIEKKKLLNTSKTSVSNFKISTFDSQPLHCCFKEFE